MVKKVQRKIRYVMIAIFSPLHKIQEESLEIIDI